MAIHKERCFPRGGNKSTSQAKPKRKSKRVQLFDVRKKKSKSKKITKGVNDTGPKEVHVADQLSYRTLSDGMTVLGCVIGITNYYIRVSLPGRLVGKVAITDVSSAYSKILRSLLDKKEVLENYFDLKQMFTVGQFVVAKVVKVTKLEENNRHQVDLTLDPARVNVNYSHSGVKSGLVLQGAVKSVEDHGYMVDFGIKSLTAFLKAEKAKSFISKWNGGKKLGVGQLLPCRIQRVDNASSVATVVQVTADPREVSSSFAEHEHNININTLNPGTLVKTLVVENIADGILVEFLNFKGYVHRDHVGHPPKLASICQARVLYTVPLLNTVYLSLLLGQNDLYAGRRGEEISGPKVGQVIREAVVMNVSRRGVVIRLGKYENCKGYVARNKLRDGQEVAPEDIKGLLPSGTELDVRIIGHDMLENIFICSAQKSSLDQEYFDVGDLQPGMTVMGSVVGMSGNGLVVKLHQSNNVQGYVPCTQFADFPLQHPEKRYPPGKQVKARVMKVIRETNNLLLTLKPSLVDSELPVLDKHEKAESLGIADGTVFKIVEKGLVVIFYNGVKGFVPIDDTGHSSSESTSLSEAFFEGQTVRCRVISYSPENQRMRLSLELKVKEDPVMMSRLGKFFTVKVTEVTDEELLVKVVKSNSKEGSGLKRKKGIIPALHLSDCASLASSLLKTYKPGETISPAVLYSHCPVSDDQDTLVFSLRPSVIELCHSLSGEEAGDNDEDEAEDKPSQATRDDLIKEGSIIPCSVLKPIIKGLVVEAPIPMKMFVPLDLASDEEFIDKKKFPAHQPIFGNIVQLDKKAKRIILSTQLSEVWNGYDLEPGLTLLKEYLTDVDRIRGHLKSDHECSLGRFVEGQMVEGKVKSIDGTGALVEVHYIKGMKGKVKPSVIATVKPRHCKNLPSQKPLSVGDEVEGRVIFVDYAEGQLYLTLHSRIVDEMAGAAGQMFAIGKGIRAEILLNTKDVTVALVKGMVFHGELIYLPARSHWNDFCGSSDVQPPLRLGDIHKVIVSGKANGKMIGLIKKQVTLLGKFNDGKVRHVRKRKIVPPEATGDPSLVTSAKKRRKSDSAPCEQAKSDVTVIPDGGEGEAEGVVKRKVKDITESLASDLRTVKNRIVEEAKSVVEEDYSQLEKLPRLQVDEGFVWGVDILGLTSLIAKDQEGASNESSADEEEKEEVADRGKKTKKKKESVASREEEEARVREAEERLMDPETCPQTADDFDRLVLSSPNSSIVWMKYIAFHLQNTEIEKARAVAQRALKTINFREEQEKLNIWVCLLNLENLYGTKESLEKVLQDALQMNDSMKVYFQMLQIYLDSKKLEELDSLIQVMLKKFKDRKEAWIQAGTMHMKANCPDKAGELLRRSLKSLPKRDHVDVICRWAQLEARHECGSVDRAQSLLEGVLAACPKRTDVWSSLADTLVRAGRFEAARNTLERAVCQKLPVRKMKVLFKKYLAFEESHGTLEGSARVRQLAVDYVEKGLAETT